MIKAVDIQLTIDKKAILNNVSVTIPKGKTTALIGPNGAGKSTLLHVLSRLQKQDAGEVFVDGKSVTDYGDIELAKRLSILKQENRIGSRLRVKDLVAFGRYPHNKGRHNNDDAAITDQAIVDLGLEQLSNRFLDTLSGGQRQRAFMAMSFAQQADAVLLDEPLNNLDLNHARRLMQLIKQQSATGRTFALVLHDLNYASRYADHIIAMKHGEIFSAGPTTEVFQETLLSELYETPINIIEVDGHALALTY